MGYIYYCKNIINGKGYVGQTTRTLNIRKAMEDLKIDRHTIAKRIKDGKEFKGYIFQEEIQ